MSIKFNWKAVLLCGSLLTPFAARAQQPPSVNYLPNTYNSGSSGSPCTAFGIDAGTCLQGGTPITNVPGLNAYSSSLHGTCNWSAVGGATANDSGVLQSICLSTPSAIAGYSSRDQVAWQTNWDSPAASSTIVATPSSFDTTHAYFSSALSPSQVAQIQGWLNYCAANPLPPGAPTTPGCIIIDAVSDTTPFSNNFGGYITAVDSAGASITVANGWFQVGNSTSGQVPTSGLSVYINPWSHGWTQDLTCYLQSSVTLEPGTRPSESCQEIDVLNNILNYYNAPVTITGATWSGGIATFTTSTAHGIPTTYHPNETVASVSPSGYNVTAPATAIDSTHFSVPIASNPGSYVSGGTATLQGPTAIGLSINENGTYQAFAGLIIGGSLASNTNFYYGAILQNTHEGLTIQGAVDRGIWIQHTANDPTNGIEIDSSGSSYAILVNTDGGAAGATTFDMNMNGSANFGLNSATNGGIAISPSATVPTIVSYGLSGAAPLEIEGAGGLTLISAGVGTVSIGNSTDGTGLQVVDPGGTVTETIYIKGGYSGSHGIITSTGSTILMPVALLLSGANLQVTTTNGMTVGSPTGSFKGAGTINAAGAYYANGTAGVTCAGSPTTSFASTNGIVTHC